MAHVTREEAKMEIAERGRRAALFGELRQPPETLSWEDQHWWLAGYSDHELAKKRQAEAAHGKRR